MEKSSKKLSQTLYKYNLKSKHLSPSAEEWVNHMTQLFQSMCIFMGWYVPRVTRACWEMGGFIIIIIISRTVCLNLKLVSINGTTKASKLFGLNMCTTVSQIFQPDFSAMFFFCFFYFHSQPFGIDYIFWGYATLVPQFKYSLLN